MKNGRSSDSLVHYGIRGMKWGVRRYQNADGSLTSAGKKRMNTFQRAASNARRMKTYSDEEAANFRKQSANVKTAYEKNCT